jgi:hypothetical protein
MASVPSALVDCIRLLRPLFRLEVLTRVCDVMRGLLIGEAQDGTARASVLAGSASWPPRLSDRFGRHQLSHPACMATLVEVALASLAPAGRPRRLVWMAASPSAETPDAKRTAAIGLLHRTQRVGGQAKQLPGHCAVCAAHLSTQAAATLPTGARGLVGAVGAGQGRSSPALGGHGPSSDGGRERCGTAGSWTGAS